MDELAREYHETHDPEIPEEIYELARAAKGDGPLKVPGDGLAFCSQASFMNFRRRDSSSSSIS
jgi:hypothetical protein